MDTNFCKGSPCTIHKLHRYTVASDGGSEADGYVVACTRAHAGQAAWIEVGPEARVVEEAEDMDGEGRCSICTDESGETGGES